MITQWPSPESHLTLKEAQCHGKANGVPCCDGSAPIDLRVVNAFEFVRKKVAEFLGKETPIHVSCVFRCKVWNRHPKVGGSKNSFHKKGWAIDIALPSGVNARVMAEFCLLAGFTGIGLYDSFVHADFGPEREWDNRT